MTRSSIVKHVRRSMGLRLVVAALMSALLLLALAYWWLENLPHELFGTAMLLLLAWHLFTKWSWFCNLARGRYSFRRSLTVALHVALLINMFILLFTSLSISKSLFRFLSLPNGPTTSEAHWFAAYWGIVIVGIHLGLHWPRVVAIASVAFGLSGPGPSAIWLTRALAAAVVMIGISSLSVLEVVTKLSFRYSVDFWDFDASVLPFFVRWTSVMALAAIVTHCVDIGLAALPRRRNRLRT